MQLRASRRETAGRKNLSGSICSAIAHLTGMYGVHKHIRIYCMYIIPGNARSPYLCSRFFFSFQSSTTMLFPSLV